MPGRGDGRLGLRPELLAGHRRETVRYRLDADAVHADAEACFVGPVLGVAAQQRGELLLHASAVPIGDGVVAFTAPPGAGKSTLAASFALAGYPLCSDDVLPVRFEHSRPLATPFLPKMKLWRGQL